MMVLPFAMLLAMIALFPLIPRISHWWENNRNKLIVSSLCALCGIMLYSIPTHDLAKVLHIYLEYITFIALLASLFIVSGGIHISGAFAGLPYINTIFLGAGAILANLMGTTGASMLLIRPLIRANRLRRHKTHIIIFFIFIVSNMGGCLTPLGDPPLYLGFLRGVPFDWTLRLFPQWVLMVFLLLFIFHLLDERMFDREEMETKGSLIEEIRKAHKKFSVEGMNNIFYLVGIVGTIVISGYFVYPTLVRHYGEEWGDLGSKLFQIFFMVLIAIVSYRTTARRIHQENHFSFDPIYEVAVLFFGIFGAMIPALSLLQARGSVMGISEPWHFFWATGLLSSFLDNAPTYLT
jgi:Na+/H+ antiporter NhaD/arsenite permease-like protein